MKIDFGDLFASGFGLVIRQIFLFFLAIWVGCAIAAISWIAGDIVRFSRFDPRDCWIILASPLLLLSVWLLPNLIFLAITGCRLVIYSESTGFRTWAALIGGETLFSMPAVTRELRGAWPALATAWLCCLILIAMVCTALWFFHQWQINRWAGELAMLKSENAMRRAELKETYGIDSAGHDDATLD